MYLLLPNGFYDTVYNQIKRRSAGWRSVQILPPAPTARREVQVINAC